MHGLWSLLFLKDNTIQNTSTDNIQVLQYLITRSINIGKDVILQQKIEKHIQLYYGNKTKISLLTQQTTIRIHL